MNKCAALYLILFLISQSICSAAGRDLSKSATLPVQQGVIRFNSDSNDPQLKRFQLNSKSDGNKRILELEGEQTKNEFGVESDRLIHATKQSEYALPDCLLKLKRRALVLVCNGDGWTAVHNIHDDCKSGVIVVVDGVELPLAIGEEIIFASNSAKLVNLLAACPIGRRNLQMYELPDGAVAMCEARFTDLVKFNSLLSNFCRSNHPVHRGLSQKAFKTAACKMIASAYKGPYHKFVLGEKREPVHALTPEVLQEMQTLAKHPCKGGFKGM